MRHSSKQIEALNQRIVDVRHQLVELGAAIHQLPEGPQRRDLLKVFREAERALAALEEQCP